MKLIVAFIGCAAVFITGVIMLIKPTSSVFAFKTRTASKSSQTQAFCNKLSAKIMTIAGAVSSVAVLATGKATVKFFGTLSATEFVVSLLVCVILISIPIVNYCCKKKFPD